ncbi:hypothetical protein IWQ49_003934 [Labrenzia sp. EL_126]|nr:hypothetical protein [Labrenzia sp. EL_126]
MNIENLTYGDVRKISALVGQQTQIEDAEVGDGRPVIVRSRDAGVLFGHFAGRVGSTVKLRNARQMWHWKAAQGGTLIDCAKHGVEIEACKFSVATATAQVFNACTLIDCHMAAAGTIEAVKGGDWS